MLIVGLTGGIASGKSTVSQILAEKYQLTVIDADKIARQVLLPGTSAYAQVLETFGPFIPNLVDTEHGNKLNNAALGAAVFGNKENLRKLNSISHPAIRREICRRILKAYLKFNRLVILDVPLLFESGLYRICGLIVTVNCDERLQIDRLQLRNPELSLEDARKRILSQMTNFERCFKLDIVINNNDDLDHLKARVELAVRDLRPSWAWTILDWFPPFAAMLALYTLLLCFVKEKVRGKAPQDRLL